jgi:hypothetical protein
MIRILSPRFAAALFIFSAAAQIALPAGAADRAAVATPTEATYAAVLRTINPKLPVEKARAYARSVMADAWRTHLDPRFIMSIVTVESRWRSNALSRSGARGLGQLMPATARRLGVNAWSPSENLRGTSSYLKTLMDHFAGKPNAVKLAIAGYNAGPNAVERYHGVPPYTETRNYVVRVLHVWGTLNTRVGRALAPPRSDAIAVRPAKLPDIEHWLGNENDILPATAAAVEAVSSPVPAAVTSAEAVTIAAPQPEPAK